MGMFDNITWADSLPFSTEMEQLGLAKNDFVFQTKDLDCAMAEYTVQGGKLFLKSYYTEEWVKGDPKAKSVRDRLGYIQRDGEHMVEVAPATRTIYMYDFRYDVMDKWDCWIEYEVIFVDGKVTSTKLHKFEKTDNAERKLRDVEFREQMRQRSRVWYNRFLFHTRPWRFISRRLSRSLYRLGNAIYTISRKIP